MLFLVSGSLPVNPQTQVSPLQHSVTVINVEVPVRVFQGDRFVANLTLNDFEVYEDGVIQSIEAVYLIKKTSVDRKQVQPTPEKESFQPKTSRTFYIFFTLYEYVPKIREAISYFINKVLQPEDSLVVATPKTTYTLKSDALMTSPKEKVADRLADIVRKDILAGDAAYRSVLRDLKMMARSKTKSIEDQMDDSASETGFASDDEYLMKYRADLERLKSLRTLDEKKLFDFAKFLRNKSGQKFVFLFYQREYTPMPSLEWQFRTLNKNDYALSLMMMELFDFYKIESKLDLEDIKKAYADSSVTINFLYVTTSPNDIRGTQLQERSWDVFESFADMAKATGGMATSSANVASLMVKATEVSENYYLIYYSPKDKKSDGRFRQIEVKVKTEGCRVTHLAGYYSK
jgi:VWFA-related protein